MEQRRVGGRMINTIDIWPAQNDGSRRGIAISPQQFFFYIKKNSRFNPVPEHVHDYVEVNYVYSGICPQVVNGEDIVLQQGQVLIININTPHSVAKPNEDDIMISVIVSHEYLHEKLFHDFSRGSILASFFIQAITQKTERSRYIRFSSENNQLIQRQKLKYAAKLLKNTDLSVTETANECGYENVSFFYQKFREYYHCSPKEYRHL